MKDKIKLGVSVTSLYIKPELAEVKSAIKALSKYFNVSLFLPKEEPDIFGSVSVKGRVESINIAARECEVVLSLCGGFNQIELLQNFSRLKFRKDNIFVGQSDNTLLVNCLPALGICKGLYGKGFYNIATSKENTDRLVEELYESVLSARSNIEPKGAVNLIGGNNYTFDLLQGTKFSPDFSKPFILFMEGENILEEPSETWVDFIRNIDSVMLQDGAESNIKGLIIGKFPDSIKINKSQLDKFIGDRPYLINIPILTNYPCGHNKNSLEYLPIGEKVSIEMLNLKERKN